MSHQGKTLGVFSKDKMEGPFCEQWENRLNQHSFTTVNFFFCFFEIKNCFVDHLG
jgi:hypothetical protein